MKWFDGTSLKMTVFSFGAFIKLQCTKTWVSLLDRTTDWTEQMRRLGPSPVEQALYPVKM